MNESQRGGILFRLLGLLMLAMLIGVVYLVRYPLLRLAGGWWEVQDRSEHADAILVLGDDNFSGDRAAKGAELVRAGWAPVVVASGRLLRPYAGIAELMARDLEMRGAPPAAVVRFPQRAANTREEAEALRGLVASHDWHRVIVVTSNYHTRRAGYIFRKVFPPKVTVLVVSATDSDYDPDAWWESRQGRKLFFLETVGYIEAMWESWNGDMKSGPAAASAPAAPVSASPSPANK